MSVIFLRARISRYIHSFKIIQFWFLCLPNCKAAGSKTPGFHVSSSYVYLNTDIKTIRKAPASVETNTRLHHNNKRLDEMAILAFISRSLK